MQDREAIEQKRDMARRARRLAETLTADADRNRLLQHAAELEAEADRLEAEADKKPRA